MKTSRISKQINEYSNTFAYISLINSVTFLLLLILLHFLKSELNPTWHMVSEYAIGTYGWLMQLAFGCLAISCFSMAMAVFPDMKTPSGYIGLVLFIIAAIGLIIAAFNNTDPINTAKDEMSSHGYMHGLGFMIGVPSFTIAIILISMTLPTNQSSYWKKQLIIRLAQLPWVSIVVMILTMIIFLPKNDGKFGPNVLIGLPNRIWVIACCLWIIIVAFGIIRQKKKKIYASAAITDKNENNMENQSLTITVKVNIDKPIESVWQVWSTPADIMQWNIPFDNWHSPYVENDLKPGGNFLFRMEAKDGSEGFNHSGKYDKVIKNKLIEYTGNDGRKSIIEFISNGHTTTIIETFEPEKSNPREMQKDFCQSVLNNFKKHIEIKNDLDGSDNI